MLLLLDGNDDACGLQYLFQHGNGRHHASACSLSSALMAASSGFVFDGIDDQQG
jgi:hypothetical protein